MTAIVLSLMVLTTVALAFGAIALWRRGAPRGKVALMALLAVIVAINVAIWTMPDKAGESPLLSAAPPR